MNGRIGIKQRHCETCSQCCRLLSIDALQKPAGEWCKHCEPGAEGCTIYQKRPEECSTFHCDWRLSEHLGSEWFPQKSKLIVVSNSAANRIDIHVDPNTPTRWREEPYFSQIKLWSVLGAEHQKQVIVYIKNRAIVVLPNKEVDLGHFGPTDHVVIGEKQSFEGREWCAYVVPIDQIPFDERDRLVKKQANGRDV